jgi:mono/diheme cytochrome c family protein
MKIIRDWIAVLMVGVAVFFLEPGCATKTEKPKPVAQMTISAPNPPPVQPVTAAPPPIATTPPVYVPDMSHMNDPLPDGVLVWDDLMKTADAAADQPQAHFTFNFTNASSGSVAIISVRPSCGCTTAQLPPLPWVVASGTNGQIGITVNLAGKSGTLIKTINVSTDKGSKTLMVRINMLPPVIPTMTDADRARGMELAKVDRQAVFKNDCAICHAKPGAGKYGKPLYDAVCGVCHESEHRATMVPDLHALKTPTNVEFWRTWIAHGKPGSLMPAFSAVDGGPLNDVQIASLAAYLDSAIPSHAAPPPQ